MPARAPSLHEGAGSAALQRKNIRPFLCLWQNRSTSWEIDLSTDAIRTREVKREIRKMEQPVEVQPEVQPAEEYRQVARRIANIEKFVETIEHVADKGVETWSQHLANKMAGDDQARRLEDKQHQRTCWVLVYACTLLFGLSAMCLLKGQSELVKLIFDSSLAVAAGAGLTSVLRTTPRKPSPK